VGASLLVAGRRRGLSIRVPQLHEGILTRPTSGGYTNVPPDEVATKGLRLIGKGRQPDKPGRGSGQMKEVGPTRPSS
jgi:hypothetical protein